MPNEKHYCVISTIAFFVILAKKLLKDNHNDTNAKKTRDS